MKIVFSIIHSDDSVNVTEELTLNHFSVTKLATTGGFMRKGNTTLMIGTEEERVEEAITIIKTECGKRKQVMYNMPYTENAPPGNCTVIPVTIDVGGAVIFVVDVDRYEKV